MRKIYLIIIVIVMALSHQNTAVAQAARYKCMIQMTNYMGEKAYLVVSLINKDGSYGKTLSVLGGDKKWYPDIKEWHKAYKKKPTNISAITGASIAGGDRSVVTLNLEKDKINTGYKLRFETAVEDKPYHVKDVEIPLTTGALAAKTDGTGYIRYVRFSAVN